MAIKTTDRVQETTNTTGTGTLTLAGAVAGYQSFAAIGNGNSTYYTITSGNDWEVGLGTYTASGTTLSRDTVYSSSAAGAKINVAAGAKVFVTYPSDASITNTHGHFDGPFTGSYIDGIVIDYDTSTGNGRISVGASDGIKFYNGGVGSNLLGEALNNGNWDFNGTVTVGLGTAIGGITNPLISANGNANNYVEVYSHNDNAGTSASADVVVYPNNGTDASGWADFGVNSSGYADATYTLSGPNEGYLLMSAPSGSSTTGNFVFGTDSTGTSNAFQWYVGGFTQTKSAYKMQLDGTNLTLALPLNSTVATGTAPFTVASTTQVANLNAATAGTATNATNVANTGSNTTNASYYPTLVANNTTSNQGVSTAALFSYNPSTGIMNVPAVDLDAGTATRPPALLVAGTNLTTAAAGAVEYDTANTILYFTGNTTNGRGLIPTTQYFRLAANGSAIATTISPFFGANSSIPLVANGVYEIEMGIYYSRTTAGTVVYTLTNSTTVTNMTVYIQHSPVAGYTAVPTASAVAMGALTGQTAAAVAFTATASQTLNTNQFARLKIILENGSSTSVRLNVTNSAGTVTPLRGSFWKATRITNVGTYAA